jgi:hypothetical protein
VLGCLLHGALFLALTTGIVIVGAALTAGLLRRLRPSTSPGQIADLWQRPAAAARSTLSGQAFLRTTQTMTNHRDTATLCSIPSADSSRIQAEPAAESINRKPQDAGSSAD